MAHALAHWRLFDAGRTIGEQGSENGTILLDEENEVGVRITLEEGGGAAPFSITCGVYGAMVHTRFFSGQADAREAYAAMKPRLVSLVLLTDAADWNIEMETFVADFP